MTTDTYSSLPDILSTLVAAQDAARREHERTAAPLDERHPYHTSAEALGAYLGVRGHRLTVDPEGGPRRPVRVLTLRPQAEAPTSDDAPDRLQGSCPRCLGVLVLRRHAGQNAIEAAVTTGLHFRCTPPPELVPTAVPVFVLAPAAQAVEDRERDI